MAVGTRSLAALPKAHLHLELEGSFPADAVRALAERHNRTFRPPEHFDHIGDFISSYCQVPRLVETRDELAELCLALVVAEAGHGVMYAEPAIEPELYAPRLGSPEEVLAVMCQAFAEAQRATGVEVGALYVVRTDGCTEGTEAAAALAAQFAGRGVVAFGTTGFKEPARLARFAQPVARARAAGLRIVCRAGHTGGADSVRDALDQLAPDRLTDGIRACEDPSLMRRLADEGVICAVSPSSDVALRIVADLARHPLLALLEAGVAVTLNAGDELFFQRSVTDQFQIARNHFAIPDLGLADIASNGAWGSGMSEFTRQRLLSGVDAWLNGS